MSQFSIQFNGASRDVSSSTVLELLKELNLEGRRIAVELNREVVSRTAYGETPLHPGDKIEIIQFVGGG